MGTRDNSFGDDLPDCTNQGGSVRDDSSTTCESIFARGIGLLSSKEPTTGCVQIFRSVQAPWLRACSDTSYAACMRCRKLMQR